MYLTSLGHLTDIGLQLGKLLLPASVVQLDACPTGDQEVAGSTPLGRQHSFMEI